MTVDPSPTQLVEYAGEYVSDEIDPVYRLKMEGDTLTLLRLKNKPDPLPGDAGRIYRTIGHAAIHSR